MKRGVTEESCRARRPRSAFYSPPAPAGLRLVVWMRAAKKGTLGLWAASRFNSASRIGSGAPGAEN